MIGSRLRSLQRNSRTFEIFSVFESSEWPYVGLFSGKVDHWGNYDECLMVSSHGLRGQYCLAEAAFDFPANSASVYGTSVAYQPDEEASVWDTLQMVRKYRSFLVVRIECYFIRNWMTAVQFGYNL